MSQRVKRTAMRPPGPLTIRHPHAAGIDVGSRAHWVAVPPEADPESVRCFDGYTPDLHALSQWLRQCGVT